MSTNIEPAARRLSKAILSLLALAAAAIAGYLLIVAVGKQGLPVGCGDESGCAEVLTSRWSVVFGIPVSAPAFLLYLAVFAASLKTAQPPFRAVLMMSAVMMLLAAIWFTALQFLVLKALCPWCLTEHGLGVVMALMIFRRPWKVTEPQLTGAAASSGPSLLMSVLVGCLAFGLFVGAQFLSSAPTTTTRLPAGANADTGPGPDRQIAMLQGRLQLLAHDEPILGSPDAPKLLCVMFDYCCPHCRRTHAYVQSALEEFPRDLAVVTLPMPRDADCNPSIEETEPRFEHACELAELALAVWLADRQAFPEFDRWLFETTKPRPPGEARAKAQELVTRGALATALTNPVVKAKIARNVQAYSDSGAEYIPVLMSPGFDTVVGRPESEEALIKILREELFTTSTDPDAVPAP